MSDRPPMNKLTMDLGNGVVIATNSFKAQLPAWMVKRENVGVPEKLEDPTCWIELDSGTVVPCWLPPEKVTNFLMSLATGGPTW